MKRGLGWPSILFVVGYLPDSVSQVCKHVNYDSPLFSSFSRLYRTTCKCNLFLALFRSLATTRTRTLNTMTGEKILTT